MNLWTRKDQYVCCAFLNKFGRTLFYLSINAGKNYETDINNSKLISLGKMDGLSEHFLKDGAKFLAKPIRNLCDLSITSEQFPESFRETKLKPPY